MAKKVAKKKVVKKKAVKQPIVVEVKTQESVATSWFAQNKTMIIGLSLAGLVFYCQNNPDAFQKVLELLKSLSTASGN